MKKVLIIANLFHASPRVPGLTKYLTEFGWQPIILTTPIRENQDSPFGPPSGFKRNCRVIETYGYSPKDVRAYLKGFDSKKLYEKVKPFLASLYKFYQEFFHYPDSEKGWKPFAVRAGNELLQKEDIDAMISSSSPVTSHVIAKELKSRHRIPWVADLRDLWTQNHYYPYGPLRKLIEKRLETKTLSTADAIVTASQVLAEKLKILHRRDVYTITNGFYPDELRDGNVNLTSKFTIAYTGRIYTHKQDSSRLLAALKDLISCGTIDAKDVEVGFYGQENKLLYQQIEQYGLSAIVKQYGKIPREISFEKQRESQLLLLLNWEDAREKGIYTVKIFEYLAAQRPILATGGFGNDVVEALLKETNSGTYCSTVEDIKNTLKELYSEYKFKGKVTYNGNIEKINKYSYREMARKFAEILDSLM